MPLHDGYLHLNWASPSWYFFNSNSLTIAALSRTGITRNSDHSSVVVHSAATVLIPVFPKFGPAINQFFHIGKVL